MYAADAHKFKDQIKKQFLDYRTKFRSVMNEVRDDHYDDFAKLGVEKESNRVAKEGNQKSGENVYKHIKAEVEQMKERLKAAGVNRAIPALDDLEYDSEEPSEDESSPKKESRVQDTANSASK